MSYNGTYSTATGYEADAVGTWHWMAEYSGDGSNDPVSSDCADELVVAGPETPEISTTPDPAEATVGDTLNDSATLSGGYKPTGTITFKLFGPSDPTCEGTPVYIEEVEISGNGTYSTTTGYEADAIGTWHWTAEYSGGENNDDVSSLCADEPVVVNVVKVIKTETIGGTSSGALTYGYEFVLTGGPDDVEIHKWANIGDPTPVTLDFGVLKAGDYTLCELAVPAGVHSTLEDLGGTVDPTTGDICLDFTLDPGTERVFEIDNSWPGGGTRTIGYWKNWNSCSHDGSFVDRAAKTGNHLADDFLPILIGDLDVDTACIAMDVLNKSPIGGSAKKTANDAAYSLAAQLLAAKLNVAAGAGHSTFIDETIAAAQALLDDANFNGTGTYWRGGKNAAVERQIALELADILDQYNNGTIP